MKNQYRKQTQFELFPGAGVQPSGKKRSGLTLPQMAFSLENLIVLGVVIVVSMVVSFSLGVEKGKKRALNKETKRDVELTVVKKTAEDEKRTLPEKTLQLSEEAERALAAEENLPIVLPPPSEETEAAVPEEKKNVEGLFTVQVASFEKEKTAQKEAMELKKKGFKILVLPKGQHSIVCVGTFDARDEAKLFSKKLKQRYSDCLIRRL